MNPAPGAYPGVFYEQEVNSFPALSRRLRVLDQDSGVRVLGGGGKERYFVFVTRFGNKYTVMTYSMRGASNTPGRKLETLEFGSVEELEGALKRLVRGRLRAWVY